MHWQTLGSLKSKIGLIKFLKRHKGMELGVREVELIFRLTYQPKGFKTKLVK